LVVNVKLKGLQIFRQRAKWYVYRRATGEALVRGFEGDRAKLDRVLESAEFLAVYNRRRLAKREAHQFGSDTLGGLLHWYTNGDIDRPFKEALTEPGKLEDGYPKWHQRLAKATRLDYLQAFDYLRPEFDIRLADIMQSDLYDLRDKCANKKWPRFADKMISALSSAFRQAIKRSNKTGMTVNPCLGMEKIHEADPNANREWFPEELPAALTVAPPEIKTALMLARYAGLRGQTIVEVGWKQYRPHQTTGMAIQLITRKNNEPNFLPALPELQDYLASLQRGATLIAIRDDGTSWNSEKDLQSRVSHWLRDREREGLIGAGTTLHGLRVTYAAWWKRNGATDAEIADLLGDKSQRMGTHYTRHVTREDNVIRAFARVKDKK
jgi:integrase